MSMNSNKNSIDFSVFTDKCFIPGVILLLEETPIVAKLFIFSTILLLIIVHIDKGRHRRIIHNTGSFLFTVTQDLTVRPTKYLFMVLMFVLK